jgi:hypothetical protein
VEIMTDALTSADVPVIPPMLYVPVADYAPDAEDIVIDFRRIRDGQTALLAYSALDRLIDGCGPAQPWVVLPTSKLDEIKYHTPFDVLLLDVTIPEARRRKTGGQ